MAKQNIQWLNKELPELVEKGIISEDTSRSISAYYHTQDIDKEHQTIGILITAIMGALLIGAGMWP